MPNCGGYRIFLQSWSVFRHSYSPFTRRSYGGCLAPHSKLREAIRPTPRQRGEEGEETPPATPYWHWARLLSRVFALEMATCPFCRRGSLRLIAVITQESVITRILRHLQLAAVPPPLAPARGRQALFAFD